MARLWCCFWLVFLVACAREPNPAPMETPDLSMASDLPEQDSAPELEPEEDLPPPCDCQAGPCCDGCDFLLATELCAVEVAQERSCDQGQDICGLDVRIRHQNQYCSGQSAACDGERVWGPWVLDDDCTPDQTCDPEAGACRSEEACAQRCEQDADCVPEQHCSPEGVCTRDVCVQSTRFCGDNQRRQCDARGASWEVLETCEGSCTPQRCVPCPSNFCQDNDYGAGTWCDESGELIQCSYEGSCRVEAKRQQCADPTPLCNEGRCIGCLQDFQCPSRYQACVGQFCQCQSTCSEGTRGCNTFSQQWICSLDNWGCEYRRVVPCPLGQSCVAGECVCSNNICQQLGVTDGYVCERGQRIRCGEEEGCAVEIFSQACPCSCTEGVCDDCDAPNIGTLVLGTGEARFAPLEDGQAVNLYAGIQGGHHIFGALRAFGITDPSLVSLEFYVLDGAVRLTTWSTVVNLDPIQGQDGYEWYGVTVMFPLGTDPDMLNDLEVTLVLDARTSDNRLYTDARDIVIAWPPR